MRIESCQNCEREIGKLERAFIFKDKIVCAECDKRLRAASGNPNEKRPAPATAEPANDHKQLLIGAGILAAVSGAFVFFSARTFSYRAAIFASVITVSLIFAVCIADLFSNKPIICPNTNCRYRGLPKRIPRGNVFIGLFLCLFFLLPGVLYFIFKGGYRYVCPRCGMQVRTDN